MLAEGQKWFYKCDDDTNKSHLIIRRIERHENNTEVVHITIKDINVEGELWDIIHLPVEGSVLTQSLQSMVEDNFNNENKEEFEEAYSLWKNDKGGVWSINLKDIIKHTLVNSGILPS